MRVFESRGGVEYLDPAGGSEICTIRALDKIIIRRLNKRRWYD